MRLLASIIVLSAIAAPAFAQSPAGRSVITSSAPAQSETTTVSSATVTAAETDTTKGKADGMVCRKVVPTGSTLPKRVCTTASERQTARGNVRRAQENLQGRFANGGG